MKSSHLRTNSPERSHPGTVTALPPHRTGGAGRPAAASPYALAGEVVDSRTREPVAGARAALAEPIDLLCRLSPPPPSRSRRGVADAEGRFELHAPGGAPFWLLVHHPRYLPELVEVRPGHREIEVALQQPGTIRGRLLDAEARPLAGVRIRGFCPSAVDAADTRTGADGTFRLEGLRPGAWMVGPDGASAGGLAAAMVELLSGETAEAELRHGRPAPEPVG